MYSPSTLGPAPIAPPAANSYGQPLPLTPRSSLDDQVYRLPPFAKVTLARVDAAGAWQAPPGVTQSRGRLLTVDVAFG